MFIYADGHVAYQKLPTIHEWLSVAHLNRVRTDVRRFYEGIHAVKQSISVLYATTGLVFPQIKHRALSRTSSLEKKGVDSHSHTHASSSSTVGGNFCWI